MNLVENRTLHPHLRDEEALVVENAIRLAIDSIINVLYGVNSARTHEYQRMVADRDKEIQRLECRLKKIEHDLQVPRRHGCTCGFIDKAPASHGLVGAQSSGDAPAADRAGFDLDCIDAQMTAAQQDCAMSLSFGLFGRPPSHVSSQSHESAPPSSPSRLGLDQNCTSHSSESSSLSEAARILPASPGGGGVVIKEEPCDMDAVFIKWEMSEEGFMENQESGSSPYQDKQSLGEKKKLEDRERRTLMEQHHADGHHVMEAEHLRNRKKSVPMSELPEEAQRLKRAAWRAASRRYYARKVARQQANPSCSAPFPHVTDSRYSQPLSVTDKRRRMLISELPDESQTLQREAWRAASRRYYARKNARHQMEPAQFVQLLHNMDPSEDASDRGGILCS